MASVFDVAKYILDKQGKISTWKLQKLCYYSQAWALAWTEKPLFCEDFEAWSNGPVCRVLFNAHKGKYYIVAEDIIGDVLKLTDDEKDSINVVLKDYGMMEPYELREQSHAEAPWKNARGDLRLGEYSNAIISKESMAEYYGAL